MDLRPPDHPTAVPFDATPYTKQPERSPIPHPNGSQGYVFRAGTEIEKLVGVRQNRAVHGRNTSFEATSSPWSPRLQPGACDVPTSQTETHRNLCANQSERNTQKPLNQPVGKRHVASAHVSPGQNGWLAQNPIKAAAFFYSGESHTGVPPLSREL